MSVKELSLQCYDQIRFVKCEDGKIEIKINDNSNWIDRNQAYLLMLYLQEHLK